jgi:hypothetical protein
MCVCGKKRVIALQITYCAANLFYETQTVKIQITYGYVMYLSLPLYALLRKVL